MIYLGSKELVRRCVDLSLKNLQLDYIDLYLIHFPLGFQVSSNQGPLLLTWFGFNYNMDK